MSSLKNWKGREEEEDPGKDGKRSRRRSSSAGSEKMKTVGGRKEKMEGHFSTDQSPQWSVVPMEEEEG